MNKCKNCGKETKNKVYCSTECQYEGYREKKVKRVKVNCLYCDKEFETLPNKIERGKSKYCSRECKDTHQKEVYKNEGNPVYGRKASKEEKELRSKMVSKLWEDEDFRDKVKNGLERFVDENGFFPGTDKDSLEKRKKTNLERYGSEYVGWNIPWMRQKMEETCLERYGKTSLDLMRDAMRSNNDGTYIEKKISNLLIDNGIKFETQYNVYYDSKKYKVYDFYLVDYNLLIEADGVYWHAKPELYSGKTLTETQIINVKNDKIKDKLALDKGYNLVRFWGDDISKKNFKYKLFNIIKSYGKED